MGFFDKMKGAMNAMTGGAATVHVEVAEARLGQPIKVRVQARVDDDVNLDIDGVYLRIRATESISVDGDRFAGQIRRRLGEAASDLPGLGTLTDEDETLDIKFDVAGPARLQGGETFTWEAEVTLPAGSNPSFIGRNARHTYKVFAGLDAFGNDPDSGWREIEVRA